MQFIKVVSSLYNWTADRWTADRWTAGPWAVFAESNDHGSNPRFGFAVTSLCKAECAGLYKSSQKTIVMGSNSLHYQWVI